MKALDQAPAIVWFRDDLRLADHPALVAAVETGRPLLCIYVFDQESDGLRARGAASKWWLHHSLETHGAAIARAGGRLDIYAGAAAPLLATLMRESGTKALFFNRRYEKAAVEIDRAVTEDARAAGVDVCDFVGSVLHEPGEITPKTGGFYKVFSPYWKAALARDHVAAPVPAPRRLSQAPPSAKGARSLASLDLLPTIRWDEGLGRTWTPGEAAAMKRLEHFAHHAVASYADDRNRPGTDGSSRLSPHLRFGEISPRQVYAAVKARSDAAQKYLAEVGWRDFDTALLWNLPDLATRPVHRAFDRFPYLTTSRSDLKAWQRGMTGYPIVDAGMRQLWQTGFMHNRVRMITASFLIKHLLTDWRLGEKWFWDTLCDADPANNPVNWQWVAGCGNDPVPYFRIFNPVLQGEKFDPDGAYVRAFVPELDELPDRWIQRPWEAPADVLRKAGVTLGKTYPAPMVDHAEARARALDALRRFRAETR